MNVEMKKYLTVVGIIVLLFGILVWPGLWSYAVLSGANGQALVRVNKVTGKTTLVTHTFPQQPTPPPAPPQIPGVPQVPTE